MNLLAVRPKGNKMSQAGTVRSIKNAHAVYALSMERFADDDEVAGCEDAYEVCEVMWRKINAGVQSDPAREQLRLRLITFTGAYGLPEPK